MPKLNWLRCDVCGAAFDGAEYVQVEISSSLRSEVGGRPRMVQVIVDADEDVARLHMSREWYLGGWMTTKAACLPCVQKLPAEWQRLFRRPDLSDWVPVRRLDSGGEDSDSETWLVRKPEAPSPSVIAAHHQVMDEHADTLRRLAEGPGAPESEVSRG